MDEAVPHLLDDVLLATQLAVREHLDIDGPAVRSFMSSANFSAPLFTEVSAGITWASLMSILGSWLYRRRSRGGLGSFRRTRWSGQTGRQNGSPRHRIPPVLVLHCAQKRITMLPANTMLWVPKRRSGNTAEKSTSFLNKVCRHGQTMPRPQALQDRDGALPREMRQRHAQAAPNPFGLLFTQEPLPDVSGYCQECLRRCSLLRTVPGSL